MGQKVHPVGFRIGITETWSSRWFADKQSFGDLLVQDHKIRRFIKRDYESAAIPKIEIERDVEQVHVILHSARPGLIIGKKGAKVDQLKEDLQKICGGVDVKLEIREVVNPELSAQLTAENIGQQLLRRSAFRRAIKMSARESRFCSRVGLAARIWPAKSCIMRVRFPFRPCRRRLIMDFTKRSRPMVPLA